MHVAHRLLGQGHDVVGVDNLNAYYDPHLKQARIKNLEAFSKFKFERIDIAERQSITQLFAAHRFPAVVHLAAQAGVRHSLADPKAEGRANHTCLCHRTVGPTQTDDTWSNHRAEKYDDL